MSISCRMPTLMRMQSRLCHTFAARIKLRAATMYLWPSEGERERHQRTTQGATIWRGGTAGGVSTQKCRDIRAALGNIRWHTPCLCKL